jgi:hypothetical protein
MKLVKLDRPLIRRFQKRLITDMREVAQLAQGDRTYSFDANNALSDGAAAYTASGYATYGGAQSILDTGGNQNVTVTLPSIANSSTITPQQARIDAAIVIDLTAIYTGGGNKALLMALISNDPAFGAGNVQIAGALEFGTAANLDVPNGITTPAPAAVGGSRYELLFATEQNNTKYEYVALYHVLSGTTPSITYKAFMAVLPRE